MAAPYRKIMCPVDFDDSSLEALDAAARIARDNDGTLIVLHIVPMVIMPTGMPVYVDVYKGQETSRVASSSRSPGRGWPE